MHMIAPLMSGIVLLQDQIEVYTLIMMTFIITALTFSILDFKSHRPAHRVGDQLSAGVLNLKFGQELRKLEQIQQMIKGFSEQIVSVFDQ